MPNDGIKVCVDPIMPADRLREAARKAIELEPTNAPEISPPKFGAYSPDVPVKTRLSLDEPVRLEIAGTVGTKWPTDYTVRVRFLDGDPEVQSKVEEYAHRWSQYANIHFQFGSDPDAEIQISFEGEGSWSYLGTDALGIPSGEPTMNYGWLTEDTPDVEYSRVVQHEFGHALGCVHEHNHPEVGIPWDVDAVYRYYMGSQGWTKEQVDGNLFQKYERDRHLNWWGQYDPTSIMHYAIPNELTIGDYEVAWNTDLSELDKQVIGMVYKL